MKQRINIVELARRLGLAVSTVSKALNDRGDVSDATKQRVLEAADKFSFSPDPVGRRHLPVRSMEQARLRSTISVCL